ncbi:hypothetical protein HMPREF9946_03579 [Acetobacteraceae bacterium AT-5844]|nr:hypothetical protein HMPREF9946_03579 [Acetobacteraceae bacterium AT-5844]
MRVFLVCLSIVLALALWVWATGPGTSLLLAFGGWIFAAIVGRIAYVALRPPPPGPDGPVAAPDASSQVIRPRPRHRHHN